MSGTGKAEKRRIECNRPSWEGTDLELPLYSFASATYLERSIGAS